MSTLLIHVSFPAHQDDILRQNSVCESKLASFRERFEAEARVKLGAIGMLVTPSWDGGIEVQVTFRLSPRKLSEPPEFLTLETVEKNDELECQLTDLCKKLLADPQWWSP